MSIVHKLHHVYKPGSFRLELNDWEIPDLGFTVLWGPSGAGKSSILRALMGLDSIDHLDWDFKGVQMANLQPRHRRIGVVFQDASLFWGLSAKANLDFAVLSAIEGWGLDANEAVKRREHVLDRLELKTLLNQPVELLSGGERSRVALARATVGNPRILMLDEPFSSLDAERKKSARQLVRDFIEELRIPTLLVTHDEADFNRSSDNVVRIEAGKKLA